MLLKGNLATQTSRFQQVKKINEVFTKNTYPSILAGDLNDTPDSKAINILEHIWTASYDKKNTEHTYPSDEPNKKIDYIMVLPKDRWKVIKTKTICDTIASDHCAWLVVLELLEK